MMSGSNGGGGEGEEGDAGSARRIEEGFGKESDGAANAGRRMTPPVAHPADVSPSDVSPLGSVVREESGRHSDGENAERKSTGSDVLQQQLNGAAAAAGAISVRSNVDQSNNSIISSSSDGSSSDGSMSSSISSSDGSSSGSDDEDYLVGDMCASATGVVRVQSRRKAEMFLVRTDGISCTREKVEESTLAFSHPSTQQQLLMWRTRPKTVLLLKKLGKELMEEAMEVALFLHQQERMNVIVEADVHDMLSRVSGFNFLQTFYSQDAGSLHERVDFVVCLGGDGVILHASTIFSAAVPPIVSFNLGSLGFLTAHPFHHFQQDLRTMIRGHERADSAGANGSDDQALMEAVGPTANGGGGSNGSGGSDAHAASGGGGSIGGGGLIGGGLIGGGGGVYITLRMRLRCELMRGGRPVPGKSFDVLNEVVVDRGSNPYLCKIECYERNTLITKVQADGVIVATPTGSTAYSTAAGGSMVHPNVPCMLFTPICPHSLSFRPIILPDSAILELRVPSDARSNCWASFDGKKRQQLCRGDSVRISMSRHPVPTVNKSDQTDDWFASLVRCLNWNERLEQKAF